MTTTNNTPTTPRVPIARANRLSVAGMGTDVFAEAVTYPVPQTVQALSDLLALMAVEWQTAASNLAVIAATEPETDALTVLQVNPTWAPNAITEHSATLAGAALGLRLAAEQLIELHTAVMADVLQESKNEAVASYWCEASRQADRAEELNLLAAGYLAELQQLICRYDYDAQRWEIAEGFTSVHLEASHALVMKGVYVGTESAKAVGQAEELYSQACSEMGELYRSPRDGYADHGVQVERVRIACRATIHYDNDTGHLLEQMAHYYRTAKDVLLQRQANEVPQ